MNKILITNAYSRKNIGDGLLVDLTSRLIRDAGKQVSGLASLNPETFPEYPEFKMTIHAEMSKSQIATYLLCQKKPFVQVGDVQSFVSVGGGYLRFTNRREALQTTRVHLAQIEQLSKEGIPFALMPQSVGPVSYMPKSVQRIFERAEFIALRDDKSFQELPKELPTFRTSDLAALYLSPASAREQGGSVKLLLRDLPQLPWWRSYWAKSPATWEMIVQSEQGRSNSDRKFYETIGVGKPHELRSSLDAFLDQETSTVLSVRLHGALMAIQAGIPAVHISYERKGWGVFSDLGLNSYCFAPTPDGVEDAIRMGTLLNGSIEARDEYWNSMFATEPLRQTRKLELIERIRKFA